MSAEDVMAAIEAAVLDCHFIHSTRPTTVCGLQVTVGAPLQYVAEDGVQAMTAHVWWNHDETLMACPTCRKAGTG